MPQAAWLVLVVVVGSLHSSDMVAFAPVGVVVVVSVMGQWMQGSLLLPPEVVGLVAPYVQVVEQRLGVAGPRENPRLRLLARAGDGDVLCVLECIIEVKLPFPSATLWGNPRSMDRMMAMLLRCSPLGASILEVYVVARDQ
jgi:hypothetical protein